MFKSKALYFAVKGKRPIAGILESSADYVSFKPCANASPQLEQKTKTCESFFLAFEDMLEPMTAPDAAKMKDNVTVGPGGALHRESDPSGKKYVYLNLRARLLYGVDMTPETIASYWFALMPQSVDYIYDTLVQKIQSSDQFDSTSLKFDLVRPSRSRTLSGFDEIKLLGKSALLHPQSIKFLQHSLPCRAAYNDWTLGFSTYEHGLSIKNMFRQIALFGEGPCLTIIQDTNGWIFGCYMTTPWCNNDGKQFVGGGEAFVFTIHPKCVVYNWTQRNKHIMCSSADEIIVGGSGKGPALFINGDLQHGSSNSCETFNNCCLASGTDFDIHGMEVWLLDPENDICRMSPRSPQSPSILLSR